MARQQLRRVFVFGAYFARLDRDEPVSGDAKDELRRRSPSGHSVIATMSYSLNVRKGPLEFPIQGGSEQLGITELIGNAANILDASRRYKT